MRGEILHYDVEQGIGFISAEDGSRYMFSRGDLMQAQRVGKGTRVDFRADGQNAREVYTIDPRGPSAPSVPPSGAGTAAPSAAPSVAPSGGQVPRLAPRTSTLPPDAYANTDYGSYGTPDLGMWGYFVWCSTTGYANFRGRARRKEYWSFVLFYMLVALALGIVAAIIDAALGNMEGSGAVPFVTLGAMAILILGLFVPALAVTVRRIHDLGLSGWFYLLVLIPYIGSLIIFVFTLIPSQKHDNKWGPVPDGVRF